MTIRRKITANDGIKKAKDGKADKHSSAMMKWRVYGEGRRILECHVTCTESGRVRFFTKIFNLKTDLSFLY